MTRLERRYRRIARSLSNADLMRGSMDQHLEPGELMTPKTFGPVRFLDFYGDEGIRLALDRYGLTAALAERGYPEFQIETSASDERHTLFVYADVEGRRERLVELVARRDRLVPRDGMQGLPTGRSWEILTIEWLTMRDPKGTFSPQRPRLPGQDAPGLGLGEKVLELLYRAVDRLHLEGLMAAAAHFHLAVLYALELRFFDPWYGGQLLALERALMLGAGLTLPQASWAIEWGMVSKEDGTTFRWRGQGQLWPNAEDLSTWFDSKEYRDACANASLEQRFDVDREEVLARWKLEQPELIGA